MTEKLLDTLAVKDLDHFMQSEIEKWAIPGMALSIIKKDKVVYSKGYGLRDKEQGKPVDEKTLFAIGSASKAFTTMCMGILVDRGMLEWDVPLRNYIPTFKLYDSFASERMTPRDLVCHRSGLPRHDLMWYGSSLSRKELFDRLQYLQPNKDFRSIMQYQNLMFMAAGYLIEVVSGLTWEAFCQKEIFDVLGMTRSNFSVDVMAKDDNASCAYVEKKAGLESVPYRNLDAVGPAGSINSCIEDMSKWVQLHLNGGEFEGKRIISKANLDEMHAPNMVITGSFFKDLAGYNEIINSSYGLGWFVETYRGMKSVHHGGHIDGFTAQVAFLPNEEIGVVALTNIDGSSFGYVPTYYVYDKLFKLSPVDWSGRLLEAKQKNKAAAENAESVAEEIRHKETELSHSLDAYAGVFNHPGYGDLKIRLVDEKLEAVYNGLRFNLTHYHYDIFEARSPEVEENILKLAFSTDTMGVINKLTAPFEPNVEEIVFTRTADKAMQTREYLEAFCGVYNVDGKDLSINLKGEDVLVSSMSGQQEMELVPYTGTTYKVKGAPGVQFMFNFASDNRLLGLTIIQPGGVYRAEKKKVC